MLLETTIALFAVPAVFLSFAIALAWGQWYERKLRASFPAA